MPVLHIINVMIGKSVVNCVGQMNINSIVQEIVTNKASVAGHLSNLEGCNAITMLYSRAEAQYRIGNAWKIR